MKKTILATALLFAAHAAHAAPVSFDWTVGGDINVPEFELVNTSTSATLTAFSMTIGLATHNFDFIRDLTDPTGGTSTITTGEAANNGLRFDSLAMSFTGFDPGESVSWIADIDRGNVSNAEDYRTTLFNNGPGPNSVLTASFSDGSIVSFELPDLADVNGTNTFSSPSDPAPVPLPAGLPLLLAGLGMLGWVKARKR